MAGLQNFPKSCWGFQPCLLYTTRRITSNSQSMLHGLKARCAKHGLPMPVWAKLILTDCFTWCEQKSKREYVRTQTPQRATSGPHASELKPIACDATRLPPCFSPCFIFRVLQPIRASLVHWPCGRNPFSHHPPAPANQLHDERYAISC